MASDGEISCANDPNFAVIYSFLKTFGKLYGLEVPTISKLQEFIENTQEVLDPLKELHLRLLRRAHKTVASNRWERFMIKFCHQQGHHQEAWEIERFSYKKASTTVKLKVLKLLLEYQFTCHPKFKNAVNAISCKELRLDPVGRDKNGCVYWLQVDHEANLCLYKEDQDEETWQLVARTREELVKVISQLKSGEEVCPLFATNNNVNEDSSSADVPAQSEVNDKSAKSEGEDENEEEFLSPESESEHETEEQKDEEDPVPGNLEPKAEEPTPEKEEEKDKDVEADKGAEDVTDSTEPATETDTPVDKQAAVETEEKLEKNEHAESPKKEKSPERAVEEKESVPTEEKVTSDEKETTDEKITTEEKETVPTEEKVISEEKEMSDERVKPEVKVTSEEKVTPEETETVEEKEATVDNQETSSEKQDEEEVGEAIEEPVMLVTGEGNGADCDSSYIIGEEISEPVMFFYGEGWGYDNDTGNPETIEQAHSPEENSAEENGNEECLNGEHSELSNSSNKNNLVKNVKLKSSLPSVAKRSLKNQSNDGTEVLNTDSKKHCVRDLEQSDCSNSTKNTENDLKREASNDKSTTDSESPKKNNAKKGRGKVKKKSNIARNLKLNKSTEVVNSETDNCHDSKTSIIEKRKSSVSSVDQEDTANTENEKEKSPDKELKVEDPLPPKKLRLETTPESDVNTHSNETGDSVENSETKKDTLNNVESNPIAQRKKIKAHKGKFKRKKIVKKIDDNVDKNSDKETATDNGKKECKSLKRSLLDATMSDKNKSESQSESEDDEPITSGKRLKIKPKKIITSTRKKVEAKLLEKQSSDESEEETLYSIAGKKTTKKLVKKKIKVKDKGKSSTDKGKTSNDKGKSSKDKGGKGGSDDSDVAPVRQSRRIAQMKIKEEADRRHLEEVALRELKKIHKKKNKEEEEDEKEWRASGASSSDGERRRRNTEWRSDHSTGPEPDSDSDEPLFELHEHEEPELVFNKSDHEFSPESDLESGEPVEPLKRARTLQEGKEDADGFCKRCGSGEQPEWILLCDKCDEGYHASCLKPVLFVVPEGDWFCPPCNHDILIAALEAELVKYDELVVTVEAERERKKQEQSEIKSEKESEDEKEAERDRDDDKSSEASGSSDWSSTSEEGAVYRLRARKQLPVSYRSQEYDRLISSAIKEEYVEATTSAGNQGRGKDISTIIEAAEEEKMKAEREAIEQGKPIERKKKKQRRKPRKLNSLEVPSEDDDETDEDFKDTGAQSMSSSEDISSSNERGSSSDSRSSDSLPIRRTCRSDKKGERAKMTESSPEVKKKKKGHFQDSSEESAGAKEWSNKSKSSKSKSSRPPKMKRRDKSAKRRKRSKQARLTQYDADGNVIRARVTYGGLSDAEGQNDWSPKHRTRQKKINYTEMPNTESEDEMHKSSGKHMPDSSDEYKIDTDATTDSDEERKKRKKPEDEEVDQVNEEKRKALSDLIKKTAVVPLEKLSEEVTKAKTEELQAHLNAQATAALIARPSRGRGSRGGRGGSVDCRGGRGGGRGGRSSGEAPASDDALAKLIGVKIKDLRTDGSPTKPNQVEREKKRQEREAKRAEREAKKVERLQKKEEKEKMKEQKAKEREEKRLARLAMQETKRIKKEKMEFPIGPPMSYGGPGGPGVPGGPGAPGGPPRLPHGFGPPPRMPNDFHEQPRFPTTPRLQVRAELRGVLSAEERAQHGRPDHVNALREVAGSPQPFKPITEEPSIITRMPHMINQQYRGPMMYPGGGGQYGPRQNMSMYPLHPALGPARQFPQYYQHMRGLPPSHPQHPQHQPHPSHQGHPSHPGAYPPRVPYSTATSPAPPGSHGPPGARPHGMPPGPHGPPGHGPPGHGPPGHGPPPGHGAMPPGHGPPTSTHGPPGLGPSPPGHGPRGPPHPGHAPLGLHRAQAPPGAMPPTSSPHAMPNSGLPGHGGLLSMHRGMPAGLAGALGGALQAREPAASPAPPRATPPAEHEPPVRIKAEVKTEQPEYQSPAGSPARDPSPPRDEPPRHPKIKHTENKDRRPRYPLGPYAPQYGPYGPYAPPGPAERGAPPGPRPPQLHHPYAADARPRSPASSERPHPLEPGPAPPHAPPHVAPHGPPYLPPHLRPLVRTPYGPEPGARGPAAYGPEPGTRGPAPYGPEPSARGPAPFAPHYPDVSRTSPAGPMAAGHPSPLTGGPSGPMAGGPNGAPLPLSVRDARSDRLASPAQLEPLGIVKQEVLGLVKSESPTPPGPAPGAAAPGGLAPGGLGRPDAGPAGGLSGSVFGGLVSYFSSQHEDDDDIDA